MARSRNLPGLWPPVVPVSPGAPCDQQAPSDRPGPVEPAGPALQSRPPGRLSRRGRQHPLGPTPPLDRSGPALRSVRGRPCPPAGPVGQSNRRVPAPLARRRFRSRQRDLPGLLAHRLRRLPSAHLPGRPRGAGEPLRPLDAGHTLGTVIALRDTIFRTPGDSRLKVTAPSAMRPVRMRPVAPAVPPATAIRVMSAQVMATLIRQVVPPSRRAVRSSLSPSPPNWQEDGPLVAHALPGGSRHGPGRRPAAAPFRGLLPRRRRRTPS